MEVQLDAAVQPWKALIRLGSAWHTNQYESVCIESHPECQLKQCRQKLDNLVLFRTLQQETILRHPSASALTHF